MDHTTSPAEYPAPSALPAQPALPDPLVTFDGADVETVTDWKQHRRPEIRRAFEHYVYGYAPARPSIDIETKQTSTVLDGRATLTERTIHIAELPADAPSIRSGRVHAGHTGYCAGVSGSEQHRESRGDR